MLHISKQQITITKEETSRYKTITIKGVTKNDCISRTSPFISKSN
ncbi:hypothetical protein DID75_03230 [Candidatus Marinamargulisbacteria bacterium SCGC AG-410-N11]|nr:hypothetical protein DID75_03230 [Candidatus Marinamargulisbacteria bacterium SCGC AG-410-N11]